MAVIGKFEVTVQVNGIALKEYNGYEVLETDDPEYRAQQKQQKIESHKYIEAEPDAFFALKYHVRHGHKFQGDFITFETQVDGKTGVNPIVDRESYQIAKSVTRVREGEKYSIDKDCFLRKWQFGKLTVDTEKSATTKEDVEDLGSILVEVWPSKGGPVSLDNTAIDNTGINDSNIVTKLNEKLIKGRGVDVSTRLGPPIKYQQANWWEGTKITKKPLAVFRFFYRSNEALKHLGIIERTRSPTPLSERPVESLTHTQTRELLQQVLEREEAAKKKIKQEKNNDNLNQLESLKRRRTGTQESDEDDVEEIPRPKQFKIRDVSIHDGVL